MNQHIKCAVCAQLLDDALILSCDHNLCLPCAALALRRSQNSGNYRGVTCQICQSNTVVDPGSAAQLLETPVNISPPNPTYNQAVTSPGNSKVCGHCESEMATIHCGKCQEVFCDDCCSSIHRRGRFASHTLQPLASNLGSPSSFVIPASNTTPAYPNNSYTNTARGTTAPQPSYNRMSTNAPAATFPRTGTLACKEHPDETVQYFCMQCEQPCVCAECVIHGSHKDHDVLNIKKAYPAIRGKVEEFLYGIGGQVEEILMAEQKIEQHRRELSAAINGAKQHLSKAFEEVRQRLTKKEHELQMSADSILSEALGELDLHSRNAREKARGLEENASRIRGHMSGSDPVALLNYYAEVKSSLQSTLHSNDAIAATRVPDAAARKVVLAVEQAHSHAEALQSLHGAVANLRALEVTMDDFKSNQPSINTRK